MLNNLYRIVLIAFTRNQTVYTKRTVIRLKLSMEEYNKSNENMTDIVLNYLYVLKLPIINYYY